MLFQRLAKQLVRCALILMALSHAAPANADIKLSTGLEAGEDNPLPTSQDGFYRLAWEEETANAEAVYVLEEARTPDFRDARVIYTGTDRARAMSGVLDGTYHYRVRREETSTWSPALAVHVEHHALSLAFQFLGLGALVFVLTATLIVVGHRRAESQTP